MICVLKAEREATISYITLFHFTDTCLNHNVSARYRSVSGLKPAEAEGNPSFLQRAGGFDGCGHNMTKELCADVISSLRGAQGRSAPRGKEKGDEKELKQLSGVFSFVFMETV